MNNKSRQQIQGHTSPAHNEIIIKDADINASTTAFTLHNFGTTTDYQTAVPVKVIGLGLWMETTTTANQCTFGYGATANSAFTVKSTIRLPKNTNGYLYFPMHDYDVPITQYINVDCNGAVYYVQAYLYET